MNWENSYFCFGSSTILYGIAVSGILLMLLVWMFRSHKLIGALGLGTFFCVIAMIGLRMFIPLQYVFFKYDFRLKGLPVLVYDFLDKEVQLKTGNFLISFQIYQVFCIIWSAGILVFGIRFIWKEYCNSQELKNLLPCSSEEVLQIKEQLEKKLGLHRNIEIKIAGFEGSPFIYGYRKPVIVLPKKKYSAEEYYYILLHEMLHFKKKDFLWKMAVEILIILYWWNPVIRCLRSEIDKLLELKNDEAVLKFITTRERLCYMECLLKTAKSTVPKGSALRFTDTALHMKQRFHFIRFGVGRKISVSGVLMCVFTFFMLFYFMVEPLHETQDGSFDINFENAYYVQKEDGMYDLYSDGLCVATMSELSENLPFPIYSSPKDEERK